MNTNPIDHHLQAIIPPRELWNVICHELTIPEVNIFQFVSKLFHKIANNSQLWIDIADKYKIDLIESLSDSYKKISPKKEIYLICKHKLWDPKRDLHKHVARIIGLEAFDKLPTIQDSKNRNLLAPIMKGFDAANRPMIALRYVNRSEAAPLQKKKVLIFPLDLCQPKDWFLGLQSDNLDELFPKFTNFRQKSIDRLNRLLKHEPCGGTNEFVNPQAPRTLPNGESIFELV